MSVALTVLGWILAAAAVAVAVALFVGRRPAVRSCPRCRHPLTPGIVVAHTPCTECGRPIHGERDAWRRRRHPVIGSLVLLIALTLSAWSAGETVRTTVLKVILSEYKVEETHTVFDCQVEILRPRWDDVPDLWLQRVRIHRAGRVVFDSEVHLPSVGGAWIAADSWESAPPQMMLIPVLWLRSDSGGSGGYSDTWVFDLEGRGGFLPRFHLQNGLFEESFVDGGGKPGPAQTHPVHPADGGSIPPAPSRWHQWLLGFRCWLNSGAANTSPAVDGWLDRDGFVPRPVDPAADRARDGFRADFGIDRALAEIASTVSELEAADDAHRFDPSDCVFGPLLRVYLPLVFAGHAREAAIFLRDAHRGGLGKLLESGAVSDLPRSLEAFEAMLHARILEVDVDGIALDRNGGRLVSTGDLGE